jgi:predicted dithiol-disulfide oxidoreductase (DUF899 family)
VDGVEVVTRSEWLVARRELLVREKEHSRFRDDLAAARRSLPMVAIDKPYSFAGPTGELSLLDLFEGRRQLITYHFMFDPQWDEGCPSCSFNIDHIGVHLDHLHARDTTLVAISRAPLPKLLAYRGRMGWRIPWYSSFGGDFNYDFHATLDPAMAPVEYNFPEQPATAPPEGDEWPLEAPGASVFVREGEGVFHTYSTYARGLDILLGTYNWLDLTPLGRQEAWEPPPRHGNDAAQSWLRRHDAYQPDEISPTHCCEVSHA